MSNFKAPTTDERLIANTLCGVYSEFVPAVPHSVEVMTEFAELSAARYKLMRIGFGMNGLEMLVNIFVPEKSEEMYVASVRLHIQPLASILRVLDILVAYEELDKVLQGTPVQTVLGPYFREFMCSDMSEELKALQNPNNLRPLATERRDFGRQNKESADTAQPSEATVERRVIHFRIAG